MPEFDYQWRNLDSPDLEYNQKRVDEFLAFTKLDPVRTIRQRYCLDAGCGNGRYTYAMQQLGAMRVDSIDASLEAIAKCKKVNPDAKELDFMTQDSQLYSVYDFILCRRGLSHVDNPREGFRKLARIVRPSGGSLHIMVYHNDTQEIYEADRKKWSSLSQEEKLRFCEEKVTSQGGTIHGWWDALNPKHNWSFDPKQIKRWFEEEGFRDIRLTQKKPIEMNGFKGDSKASVGFAT